MRTCNAFNALFARDSMRMSTKTNQQKQHDTVDRRNPAPDENGGSSHYFCRLSLK